MFQKTNFDDYEALGDFIKEYRKHYGLTLEKLANSLNLSKDSISKYERMDRTPELKQLLKIQNYFALNDQDLAVLLMYQFIKVQIKKGDTHGFNQATRSDN